VHAAVTAEAMRPTVAVSAPGLASEAFTAVLRLLLYIRDFVWGVCRVRVPLAVVGMKLPPRAYSECKSCES
jgi:hypothetical protein